METWELTGSNSNQGLFYYDGKKQQFVYTLTVNHAWRVELKSNFKR